MKMMLVGAALAVIAGAGIASAQAPIRANPSPPRQDRIVLGVSGGAISVNTVGPDGRARPWRPMSDPASTSGAPFQCSTGTHLVCYEDNVGLQSICLCVDRPTGGIRGAPQTIVNNTNG